MAGSNLVSYHDMRSYRVVLILQSDLTKDKKAKLLETVEKLSGGKSAKTEELGEKKLMYTIKREKKGDFVVMNLEAESIASDFEKRMLIADGILRHLTVRTK